MRTQGLKNQHFLATFSVVVIFLSFISSEGWVTSKTVLCSSLCPVVSHVLLLGPAPAGRSFPAGPLLGTLELCAGPGWARRALLSVPLCPQLEIGKAKGNSSLWKHPKSCGGNAWWGFQRSGWALLQGLPVQWDLLGFHVLFSWEPGSRKMLVLEMM